MNHVMKLHSEPFAMIKAGQKTMELRLWDEKRQQLKIGDTIEFLNTSNGETLQATVSNLYRFDSFAALYQALPLLKCGYTPENVGSAKPADMQRYYSADQQRQYGVVGIELCLTPQAPEKAMIAMSGGVDSSVAAFLTAGQGYACVGGTLLLQGNGEGAQDARAVAERLGMDFFEFDHRQDFRETVMADLVNCYEAGLTPNPCIRCNRYLKFDKLLSQAEKLGCRYLVSGHYARIRRDESTGRYLIYKALDTSKDQSYVLYSLTQYQLAHLLLPLGELSKDQVRAIAQEQGFLNAQKKDSQDICFIPDGDYVAFMERFTGKQYPSGDYLDQTGAVVGKHRGAVCYTIGQRKGLNLAMGSPVYVCGKDMAANTVTVGPNEALFRRSLIARDMNFLLMHALTGPMQVMAKARYRMTEQPATITPLADGRVQVDFLEPQRALTPGQAVVFYQGDMLLGGGTIETVL